MYIIHQSLFIYLLCLYLILSINDKNGVYCKSLNDDAEEEDTIKLPIPIVVEENQNPTSLLKSKFGGGKHNSQHNHNKTPIIQVVVQEDESSEESDESKEKRGGNGKHCHAPYKLHLNHVLPHHHISDGWIVGDIEEYHGRSSIDLPTSSNNNTKSHGSHLKDAYVITQFTGQGSVTDYAPPRHLSQDSNSFDTVILIPAQGSIGHTLDTWLSHRHASHFILPYSEDTIIKWISARFSQGSLKHDEGYWGSRSILILVELGEKDEICSSQIRRIRKLLNLNNPSEVYDIDVRYLISQEEAAGAANGRKNVKKVGAGEVAEKVVERGGGGGGFISNIEAVRHELCLSVPWYHAAHEHGHGGGGFMMKTDR